MSGLYTRKPNIGDNGVKCLTSMLLTNSNITSLYMYGKYYNHIEPLLNRNSNYERHKPSFVMFTNTSKLPAELFNIIDIMLLLQC